MHMFDTIIIGGGQAGLAVAYFLKRKIDNYLILDKQIASGGAWLNTWDSLRLFSPTEYNFLPGWPMPKTENEYPTKYQFIDYLKAYENRYDFPIHHNTSVKRVSKESDYFKIETVSKIFYAKTLVSATGTAGNPYVPHYHNRHNFQGKQLHSVNYKNTQGLEGKEVLVMGGGNSGAQILAEVSKVAKTKWITLEEPYFLPEEIDGRHLFHQANARFYDKKVFTSRQSLNDIVQVKPVKEALQRDVYKNFRPFQSFYKKGIIWQNNTKEPIDVVIWCTGFKADLKHLRSLSVFEDNRIKTHYTRVIKEPQLWLVGYGNWTGFASATVYGVGKTARQTAKEIEAYLKQ